LISSIIKFNSVRFIYFLLLSQGRQRSVFAGRIIKGLTVVDGRRSKCLKVSRELIECDFRRRR